MDAGATIIFIGYAKNSCAFGTAPALCLVHVLAGYESAVPLGVVAEHPQLGGRGWATS